MSLHDKVVTFSDRVAPSDGASGSNGALGGLVSGESLRHGSNGEAGIEPDISGNTCAIHYNQAGMAVHLLSGIDHRNSRPTCPWGTRSG